MMNSQYFGSLSNTCQESPEIQTWKLGDGLPRRRERPCTFHSCSQQAQSCLVKLNTTTILRKFAHLPKLTSQLPPANVPLSQLCRQRQTCVSQRIVKYLYIYIPAWDWLQWLPQEQTLPRVSVGKDSLCLQATTQHFAHHVCGRGTAWGLRWELVLVVAMVFPENYRADANTRLCP